MYKRGENVALNKSTSQKIFLKYSFGPKHGLLATVITFHTPKYSYTFPLHDDIIAKEHT